ncbi:Gfo/Idh/MocA family protein [Acidocella aminolytica]|jgi:2-hydroxy-4-carboxymuconate semialdehyde hemiacetal dehydrogenase|uniref:Oxidoreductase n=1 Tax=Acidocella aminolytica 101 = DSM 11237 TaxID=1120923 RepID=A0A0D6PJ14_9PROT|nr:Gfo/Idh/MocA family oxidoreductase [Acidocella aminolytica]GAN81208.1 oxidoreductase [Acidocella aminolytica 101 = DSM 11237]GBQ31876.1 4-carboxy-2-hydroxymuconate-6-semialdehyde dehydrogenase [Acidocella aminolytica 101 = DSM 11237]SHE85334.1 Oxidoreductase family, NAD-binding Rossmann fold [Acidocella aminolytica 101 = DSM 11237]
MKNICLIGHGMMGIWHSEALQGHPDVRLHTVVGKDLQSVSAFAEKYGFANASNNLLEAVNQPDIDAVIIAGPSESHAAMSMAVIKARKHLLVEIPLSMTVESAETVVEAAERANLALAVSHPMRFRPERAALLQRIQRGEETPRHIHGRFFIHRLVNIGATGIKRTWIDNILWHHSTHLVDLGLWLVGGGDPEKAEKRIRNVKSFMSALDPHTGTPMEIVILIETHDDQTLLATGSYYGKERIYDTHVVTEKDSYRLDELTAKLTTGAGTEETITEQENAWAISRDFVNALNESRAPLVTGRSVLPVLRVLHKVQAEWDSQHGTQDIPGRPLVQLQQPVM